MSIPKLIMGDFSAAVWKGKKIELERDLDDEDDYEFISLTLEEAQALSSWLIRALANPG